MLATIELDIATLIASVTSDDVSVGPFPSGFNGGRGKMIAASPNYLSAIPVDHSIGVGGVH